MRVITGYVTKEIEELTDEEFERLLDRYTYHPTSSSTTGYVSPLLFDAIEQRRKRKAVPQPGSP